MNLRIATNYIESLSATVFAEGLNDLRPTASGAKLPDEEDQLTVTQQWISLQLDHEVKKALLINERVAGVMYINGTSFECMGGLTTIDDPTIAVQYMGGNTSNDITATDVSALATKDITKMVLAPVSLRYARSMNLVYDNHDI